MNRFRLLMIWSLLLLAPSLVSCQQVVAESESCQDGVCGDEQPGIFDALSGAVGEAKKFLDDNVFDQASGSAADPFTKIEEDSGSDRFKEMLDGVSSFFANFGSDAADKESSPEQALDNRFDNFLSVARQYASTKSTRKFQEVWELFSQNFDQIVAQWKTHLSESKKLGQVDWNRFNPASLWYFVEKMDEEKNPSVKRRQHRFHKEVPINTIRELHNALYLSQLSYAGSVEVIESGLEEFLGGAFQLLYATTEGAPGEPAHFIAIKKEVKPIKNGVLASLGLARSANQPLEVIIGVRGTKEMADVLSDLLLETIDFKGGKAHAGLAKSGEWLVSEHLEMLHELLDISNRKLLKVTLIGHSLGAGAAAIATMLFNEEEWIEADAIGFGCPAVLDLVQSEGLKGIVTTVVSDSDVIPRMSGAALTNFMLDARSYDWTAKALEDADLLIDYLQLPNKEGILQWLNDQFDKNDRPFFSQVPKARMDQVLYPPGTCIHLFRDGVGFTSTFTPCSFFTEIEFTRTMVDDHLIPPGYQRAFLDVVRHYEKDHGADFDHDVMRLQV